MRDGDRCLDAALPDEPMFVLLARDPFAPELVWRWAEQRMIDIQDGERPLSDRGQALDAFEQASRMRHWRLANDGAWRRPSPEAPVDGCEERAEPGLRHGDEAAPPGQEAALGLATTRELLQEVIARADMAGDETLRSYALQLLYVAELTRAADYRTVDGGNVEDVFTHMRARTRASAGIDPDAVRAQRGPSYPFGRR